MLHVFNQKWDLNVPRLTIGYLWGEYATTGSTLLAIPSLLIHVFQKPRIHKAYTGVRVPTG